MRERGPEAIAGEDTGFVFGDGRGYAALEPAAHRAPRLERVLPIHRTAAISGEVAIEYGIRGPTAS